ncbi:hypothetical protein IBTHAUMO2_440019 [Nitrosopumilaceae archaeon]|nr:hypothetical protein IBTHAUMO2_440019 [Nitrosopumilaceae archaeon]
MTFKEFGGRTVCIIRVTMSNRQIYVHPSDKKEMFLARGPGARGKRLEGTERDDYIMGRFGWSNRGLREMAGTRA